MSFEEFFIKKCLVTNVTSVSLFVDVDHVLSKAVMLFHKLKANGALKLWVRAVVVSGHVLDNFPLGGKLFAAHLATELLIVVMRYSNTLPSLVFEVSHLSDFNPTKLTGDGFFELLNGIFIHHATYPFMGDPLFSALQDFSAVLTRPAFFVSFDVDLFHVFPQDKLGNEVLWTLWAFPQFTLERPLVIAVEVKEHSVSSDPLLRAFCAIFVGADVSTELLALRPETCNFLCQQVALL